MNMAMFVTFQVHSTQGHLHGMSGTHVFQTALTTEAISEGTSQAALHGRVLEGLPGPGPCLALGMTANTGAVATGHGGEI